MGVRDSVIGDSASSVIPFERVFVSTINPCLRRPPLIPL